MEHLAHLETTHGKHQALVIKATGRYYTHEFVAKQAIKSLLNEIVRTGLSVQELAVVDPFAGDGRMVDWLLREWRNKGLPEICWNISLWDINEHGLIEAEQKLLKLRSDGFDIRQHIEVKDAFRTAQTSSEVFDIVITNPPWEILKPDSRELAVMDDEAKANYIAALRRYDQWLTVKYDLSRPKSKFAGWGTNLSRVGAEAAHLICKKNRYVIIVLPSSFFADEQSSTLRKELIRRNRIFDISYFPAEARLFGKADTGSSTFFYQKSDGQDKTMNLTIYDKSLDVVANNTIDQASLIANNFVIPFHASLKTGEILTKINGHFSDWRSLEANGELWAGREIDETRSSEWLVDEPSQFLFVKGKMIDRYRQVLPSVQGVQKPGYQAPFSARLKKIVWRDVSRPNQKRRMIAAIVQENRIAGNSLGVVFYKNGDNNDLKVLLGIINSLVFEFQLRSFLSTGHVSLSALRKVHLPSKDKYHQYGSLLKAVDDNLRNYSADKELLIEALVARDVYQLSETEFDVVIDTFEKVTSAEKEKILHYFRHPVLKDIDQRTTQTR